MITPKGRTLFEIITGRNKADTRPLELRYYNPLACKVGSVVNVSHDVTSGINFSVEHVAVYETAVGGKKFYHTDYHLKGVSLDRDNPLRLRLRVIPDDSVPKTGCRIQLLHVYQEMEWDKEFHDNVLGSDSGVFDINQDDEGNPLAEPRRYWRVERVLDPFKARVTLLTDKDGNGKVEEHEVERSDVTYWDYCRDTADANGQPFTEYLTVEMKQKSHFFTFLRGRDVQAFQVTVF